MRRHFEVYYEFLDRLHERHEVNCIDSDNAFSPLLRGLFFTLLQIKYFLPRLSCHPSGAEPLRQK